MSSTDCSKLKGYYNKWTEGKYILGCAVFVDLLNPCAISSKSMQSDEIDILGALSSLLKTVSETDKLSSKPLEQWATYVATQKKYTVEGGIQVYQCQELKRYKEAEDYYKAHCEEYCTWISQCVKSRLAWSDVQLLRGIIFVLSTHGWEKAIEEEDQLEAVDRLVERFTVPLEGAGANPAEIHAEFVNMMQYASQHFSLATVDYRSVWLQIFHAFDSTEWTNVLMLTQLLFSLPASNGKLERVFSTVNLIKVNKRSSLSNESLDDLLVLNSERVPIQDFNPDPGINLWWESKTRRPAQKPRKRYKKRHSLHSSTKSKEPESVHDSDPADHSQVDLLEEWDNCFQVDSSIDRD